MDTKAYAASATHEQPESLRGFRYDLSTNAGWFGSQEVAWSADGVVRISDLSGWSTTGTLSASWTSVATVVAKKPLVVGTTALPAQVTGAAAEVSVAAVAVLVHRVAASAAEQTDDQSHSN